MNAIYTNLFILGYAVNPRTSVIKMLKKYKSTRNVNQFSGNQRDVYKYINNLPKAWRNADVLSFILGIGN